MSFILQWIDLIWLPVALLIVHKDQRLLSVAFMTIAFVMMRLQVELMDYIGYPNGLFNVIKSPVLYRSQIVYSLSYAFYIVLSFYSPGSRGAVHMLGALGIFFATFVVSSLIMVF